MKSIKNFRNSNDELYSGESKKNKKPNIGYKGNSQKRRFIEEFDDDDEDMDLDYKKRESIEDFYDDEEFDDDET
ncbi:MAG: hypothetical protein LBT50_06220 [Prevotellaceae bacterium]|jgi:hypothetical protein|nr:hypothetical protein [Prevotellaceae bacterium]